MTGWRWASNRLLGSDGRPFFAAWAEPGYRCVQSCLWSTKDGVRSGARMVIPVSEFSIEEIIREAEDFRAQGFADVERALTALRAGGSVDDLRSTCAIAREHPMLNQEWVAPWSIPESIVQPRFGAQVIAPRWRPGWSPEDLKRNGLEDLVDPAAWEGWWLQPLERQPTRTFPGNKRMWYPPMAGQATAEVILVRGRGLFQRRRKIMLVGGGCEFPGDRKG